MKQPSGNISAVYKYRFGEKSSVLQNYAQRQNSRSQSQTLFQDNKAEMPEEHLDRSLSRLQSLYNCFFHLSIHNQMQSSAKYEQTTP